MPLDQAKLDAFAGKVVGDLGASLGAALVYIGDRLGLYRTLADAGPLTPAELARRSGTHERYIREWLDNQAAGGYVVYDPASGAYSMTPEQAEVLAREGNPMFLAGGFQVLHAAFRSLERARESFRTGAGMEWGEHHPDLFEGTERFFRAGYAAMLPGSWILALDGVEEKLRRGGKVADVGCGHGASTIVLAKAFPRSTFIGFDYHPASVETARKRAEEAGVASRVTFEVAPSTDFPGEGYDLVALFDCLHDMADPVGAARRVRQALAPDGTWLLVEPFAHDRPEQNHNPVGRVFYGASTLICVPVSRARGGPALGAQAGEARMQAIAKEAGFRRFRRAAETPFNIICEARP
jgi:SAM-dependent methyltransferase